MKNESNISKTEASKQKKTRYKEWLRQFFWNHDSITGDNRIDGHCCYLSAKSYETKSVIHNHNMIHKSVSSHQSSKCWGFWGELPPTGGQIFWPLTIHQGLKKINCPAPPHPLNINAGINTHCLRNAFVDMIEQMCRIKAKYTDSFRAKTMR